MQETIADDEIDLIDLFSTLLKRKKMIITITVLATVLVVLYAIISLVLPNEKSYLPNEYTPKSIMLINDSSSSGGGLSSMLASSGLGGLASLAGVSAPGGSTYSALAVYLVGTNDLLDTVVEKFNLIERYEIQKSPKASSREALKKKLQANIDKETGVFSLSFTDIDPVFAQSVVNFCVSYLETRFDALGVDKNKIKKINLEKNIKNTYAEIQNLEIESQQLAQSLAQYGFAPDGSSFMLETTRLEMELSAQKTVYTQLMAQNELLKVEMASESPVFQVLEYAEVPDRKSGPSRGMLCIIVTFAAFFGSVFLAFVLNAIENIRKDPVAMAKLSAHKK